MGLAAGAIVGGVASIGSAVIGSSAAGDAANAQQQAANQAAQTQLQMYQQTRQDLAPFMSGGASAFSQLANIFGFAPQQTATSPLSYSYGAPTSGTVATTLPSIHWTPGTPMPAGYMPDGIHDGRNMLIPIPAGMPGSLLTQQPATGSSATSGQPNPQLATQLLTQFPGYTFGRDQGLQALDRSAASRGLVLSGAQLKDAQQFGNNYALSAAWTPYISELNNAASLGENAAAGAGNIGASTGAGIASSQLAAGQAAASGIVGQANQLTSGLNSFANLFSSYGSPLLSGGGGGYDFTGGYLPGGYNSSGDYVTPFDYSPS